MNLRRTPFKLWPLSNLALLTLTLSGALAVACGSDDDSNPGSGGGSPYGGAAGSGGKPTAQGGSREDGGEAGSTPASSGGAGHAGDGAGGGSAGHRTGGEAGADDAAGAGGASDAGAGGEAGRNAEPTAFGVKSTNLVSDVDGAAAHTDPQLKNAWAIAINPTAQVFWLSSNHAGSTPVYGPDGSIKALDPSVAAFAGGPGSPTGQVFNAGTNFKGDKFIVDTEDGQLLGWAPPATAFTSRAHNASAIYKGLALVGAGATQQLLAANFHDARIDIFDTDYAPVAKPNAFKDATIPAGYAPFNVVSIGAQVFVAYAKQDLTAEDDEPGVGHGYVSVFDAAGTLQKSWLRAGKLDSPWAISPAPAGFGVPASALLVGNFGNGTIDAYDAASGALVGQLTTDTGVPVVIPGLWDLKVGPAGTTDLSTTLFFSAGPGGEAHGLFGKLEAASLK